MHLSNFHSPVSPEVQPRFVKGTKRYGRRSTPEFTQTISDFAHTPSVEREDNAATRTSDDGALPVKREVRDALHSHISTQPTCCIQSQKVRKNSLVLEDSFQPLNANSGMLSVYRTYQRQRSLKRL